jgi:hypothetical protein
MNDTQYVFTHFLTYTSEGVKKKKNPYNYVW